MVKITRTLRLIGIGLLLGMLWAPAVAQAQVQNPKSGSVGIQGTIPQPPPSRGATITIPTNGQTFTTLPITVRGLCPGDVLVKIFKNEVFGGSAQCTNGSYSIVTDLFSGRNDLVARVYDSLDQQGPDSNTVSVTFNDATFATFGPHLVITSAYAKFGANPGDTLQWPIEISGGTGPYALTVEWGDGSQNDLISQPTPGALTLKHKYSSPGIYTVLIKGTDKNGETAYLQLVSIINGKSTQSAAGNTNNKNTIIVKVIWWPAAVAIPLILITFWLGRRHELFVLRKQLAKYDRK